MASLTYMVRALLAAPDELSQRLVGPDAQPWSEILDRLSRSMRADLGPVVVPLLLRLCDLANEMTKTQRDFTGTAARNILSFAWDHQVRSPGMVVIGIQAVCRTFESDVDASEALLRRALEPEHLAAHGYQEMPHLVRELDHLFLVAPGFVEHVYRSLLFYDETSDESVAMVSSHIMPLRSNRRQDYRLAVHQLGEHFERFSHLAPLAATGTVIAAVEAEVARRSPVPIAEIEHRPIQVGEATGGLIQDLSHIWDEGHRHRQETHLRMLDGFETMLVRIATDPTKSPDLQNVIDRVVRENRLAAVWRRVLRAAAKAPSTLGMAVRSLAWSSEVLTCIDTIEPAGNLIKALFPLIRVDERERIEQAILAIPSGAPEDRRQSFERKRARLLGCLSRDDIVTREAKAHLLELEANGGPPLNEPPFQMGDITRGPYTTRDWMRDEGVPVDEPQNAKLLGLQSRAASFATKFLNENPVQDEVRDVLPSLRELKDELDTETNGIDKRLETVGWTELTAACAAIARAEHLGQEPEIVDFVVSTLLSASEHEEPATDKARDERFELSGSASPTPRWHAAAGLCRLARFGLPSDSTVVDVVERLSRDPVAEVRAAIARGLWKLVAVHEERALSILRGTCCSEQSHQVLRAALISAQAFLPRNSEVLLPLIMNVFERAGEEPLADDLRAVCLNLTLLLSQRGEMPLGGQIVDAVLRNVTRFERLTIHLIQIAAAHILDGPVSRSDQRADSLRLRSIEILSTIARETVDILRILDEAWKSNGSWLEGERNVAKTAHSIACELSIRLQFAVQAIPANPENSATAMESQAARFLKEGANLLDTCQDFPISQVVHSLLETFEHLVPVAPRDILLRIAKTTRVGGSAGYQFESLGVELVVKLVRRYLADHRRLLQEDVGCREALVEVLDTFVRAGWPEALGLTFRLEDVFR